MADAFDISGKVALVTGSSKGIGKAIAEAFAAAGARVVVSSRRQEACDAVAAAIAARGGEALAIACHVGDRDQVEALADRTVAHWGRVDILVCNAGINPVYGPITALGDEAYEKIMRVNVQSPLWLAARVLPLMAENGGGSVVLMASIGGLRGNAVIGGYGVSKAALMALARNLAVEWGPKGIRVNAIAPGVVRTAFSAALTEDPARVARMQERTPLRRFGEASEIAGIAHFLASPAASFMTGQVLVADGGETIT